MDPCPEDPARRPEAASLCTVWHPRRTRMTTTAAAVALGALLLGCPVNGPVDVVAAQEQPVSGILALDEAALTARVGPQGLHVTVPALSRVPWPVVIQASVRTLDGKLLGSGRVMGMTNVALELTLGAGGEIDRLPQQASRVLHLRCSAGPWEVRARRSLRVLLHAPVTSLDVPAWLPLGAAARWLLAAQDPQVELAATTSDGVQTTPLAPLAGGFGAQLTALELGPAALSVLATRTGAPRRTDVDLAVVARPTLRVLANAPSATQGVPLHVVVQGVGAPTTARLEAQDGTLLARAALRALGANVWTAVLVPPPGTPVGQGRVVVLDGDVWLADLAMQLTALPAAPFAVTASAQDEGPNVALLVRAQDGAGQPVVGDVRLTALHEGQMVVDANGVLEHGGWRVDVRRGAVVRGRSGGALELLATVTTQDGRAASGLARVFVGGQRLAVRAALAPCAAGNPCRVDVVVVDQGGRPAQASVQLALMDVVAALQTDAQGTAGTSLVATLEGPAELHVDACNANGCGTTRLATHIQPRDKAAPLVAGPLALEQGAVWEGTQVGQRLAGTVAARLPTQRGGRDPYVLLDGTSLVGQVDGEMAALQAFSVGIHQVQTVVLGPQGNLLAASRPLVVRPPSGPVPQLQPQDGHAVGVQPGALVVAAWACGPSDVGPAWGDGATAEDVRATVAWSSTADTMGPSCKALWTAGDVPQALLQDPADRQAQAVIATQVQTDLGRITAEARALAREGSLTGTGLGAWVQRREHAYMDPFGRPYLLAAAEGRILLRGDGPDETPDTSDDATAEAPLEALLQDVRSGNGGTPAPVSQEAPLEAPAQHGAVVAGLDTVTLPDPLLCGGALSLGLVAVQQDGRVGASRWTPGTFPVGLTSAGPRWTVGDAAGVGVFVSGLLAGNAQLVVDAPWGVDRVLVGNGARPVGVTAQRVGVAQLRVEGVGLVANSAHVTVVPDGPVAVETAVEWCTGSCVLDLQAGERVAVWTPADACDAARARAQHRLAVEAAGTALVGASALDQALFQDAFVWALAEAALHPDQRVATAEAAAEATRRWGVVPAGWPAPWDARDFVDQTLWPVGVAQAVAARVAGEGAAATLAFLDDALARGDVDTAAEAALSAQRAAALTDARLAAVEAMAAGASAYGVAALARVWTARGRALEAAQLLADLGELLGHPAALQQQARVAVAWCELASSSAFAPSQVTATAPGGAAVPVVAGALRGSVGGVHTITVTAPVLLARTLFTQRAVTAGPLAVAYSAAAIAVGGAVGATARKPTGAPRGSFLLQAAPGTQLVLPPAVQTRVEAHAIWTPGESVAFQLRAPGPLDVRLAPVAYWPAHVSAAPFQDAPPRLSAQ